jgi:hypothetical protein
MKVDTTPPVSLPFNISNHRLVGFCKRWKIDEFALFGSVLRPDFRPDSDIDVMVAFSPAANWSLLDLVRMQQELEEIFGRPVDLVERDTIRNPFRRQRIMQSYQVVYASE